MELAAVFPGQGSQSVGMLADLSGRPEVRACIDEASDVLGYDLGTLMADGPEDRLGKTEYTQPAMLTAGVATWRAWQAEGGAEARVMAGHSLGEYAALVCAGALEFADAVSLVQLRGRLMQEAVPAGEGAMAAILGLEDEVIIGLCAEAAGDEVVEAVNFNAPGQVVIAGSAAAVSRAIDLAGKAGARRALALPVSVPSHCRLMSPVSEALADALASITVRSPATEVIHNVDASGHAEPDDIRAALAEQVRRPVLWVACVQAMAERGAAYFVEAGPGKVLCGLGKRIDRSLAFAPVLDEASLGKALAGGSGGD
jgi:[acyl-carrier-protein] S-malonyltransferase